MVYPAVPPEDFAGLTLPVDGGGMHQERFYRYPIAHLLQAHL